MDWINDHFERLLVDIMEIDPRDTNVIAWELESRDEAVLTDQQSEHCHHLKMTCEDQIHTTQDSKSRWAKVTSWGRRYKKTWLGARENWLVRGLYLANFQFYLYDTRNRTSLACWLECRLVPETTPPSRLAMKWSYLRYEQLSIRILMSFTPGLCWFLPVVLLTRIGTLIATSTLTVISPGLILLLFSTTCAWLDLFWASTLN